MKRLILILVVLLFVGACGGNDASGPSQSANVVATGDLTTAGCALSATPGFGVCLLFNGTAQNQGLGCATGVRGVVTTYVNLGNAVTGTQVGSAAWSYSGPTLRPGETIAFSGGPLTVATPLFGGWLYRNTITFSSVKCP